MPGEYSDHEIAAMEPTELYAAAQRGFRRLPTDPADRPEYSGVAVDPVTLAKPQPSGDVWKNAKSSSNLFTCPSGQTCRLKRLKPEDLLLTGLLDKVTRLEGLAAALAATAEGQPPAADKMPTRAEFADLLDTINGIVPLAVAEPEVLPVPPEGTARDAERLYADDIEPGDRMAIMNKALEGIKALDGFRHPG